MTIKTPTLDEIREEKDPIRKEILSAMRRISEGTPLRVPVGAYSVVSLAEEAQVKRHWLNQRHKDLRDRWAFIKDNYLEPPTPADEDEQIVSLKQTIKDLKERVKTLKEERDNWKASAELFVRALNVQEVELSQRDTAIERLKKRLERATQAGTDDLTARRHRKQQPDLKQL